MLPITVSDSNISIIIDTLEVALVLLYHCWELDDKLS